MSENNIKEFNKEKATLVLINSMGLPIARKIRLISYEFVRQDYKNWLKIYYIEKHKRKVTGVRLDEAAIALGWQDVKGAINTEKSGEWIASEDGTLEKMTKQLTNIIVKILGD